MEAEPSHNERISRLADEVARLYTFGHNVVQTAQCAAKMQEYLQAETDAMFPDDPPGTHSHYTHG